MYPRRLPHANDDDDEPPDMNPDAKSKDVGVMTSELTKEEPRRETVVGTEQKETWRGVVVLCGCMLLSSE